MRALGFGVSDEDVASIMREYDRDDSGAIEFEEFRDVMREKMGERDPDAELRKAFEVFAEAGPGQAATARPTITVKHLRRIAKELGEDVRDEELMEMIEEFDQNGDGVIDEKEFRAIMTPRRGRGRGVAGPSARARAKNPKPVAMRIVR